MSLIEGMDARAAARELGTLVHYAAGDIVYRENDDANAMYVILSGAVEITTRGRHIETITAGKALGIVSLLDEKPRTSTARASENTELAIISRHTFRYMVEEVPNFVWFVMGELAHRIRSTHATL